MADPLQDGMHSAYGPAGGGRGYEGGSMGAYGGQIGMGGAMGNSLPGGNEQIGEQPPKRGKHGKLEQPVQTDARQQPSQDTDSMYGTRSQIAAGAGADARPPDGPTPA